MLSLELPTPKVHAQGQVQDIQAQLVVAAEQSALPHRKSMEALEWSMAAQEKNMEAVQRMVVAQEELAHQMATINSSLKEIVHHLPRTTFKESILHPRGTLSPGVMP